MHGMLGVAIAAMAAVTIGGCGFLLRRSRPRWSFLLGLGVVVAGLCSPAFSEVYRFDGPLLTAAEHAAIAEQLHAAAENSRANARAIERFNFARCLYCRNIPCNCGKAVEAALKILQAAKLAKPVQLEAKPLPDIRPTANSPFRPASAPRILCDGNSCRLVEGEAASAVAYRSRVSVSIGHRQPVRNVLRAVLRRGAGLLRCRSC